MISPPALPVAFSGFRPLIYTVSAGLMQQRKRNVLAKAKFTM
jgi:hypothetical protein